MSAEEYHQACADAYNQKQGEADKYYDCPECKNKGLIAYLGADGEYKTRICGCMVKRNAIRRAKKSGMGKLLNKSFENFNTDEYHQQKLSDTARRFTDSVIRGEKRWLLTCGQSGSGKTHICSAACNELLKHGYEVFYMSWVNESGRLRRLKTDDTAYNELFHQLTKPEVLYIDDLFKHSSKGEPTDSELGIAFEVLNHRLNSDKITVISTEYTLARLRDMEEAVVGRIVEMCDGAIVQVNPDSKKNYRMRGLL
jgi:DNA replication protein DnaC